MRATADDPCDPELRAVARLLVVLSEFQSPTSLSAPPQAAWIPPWPAEPSSGVTTPALPRLLCARGSPEASSGRLFGQPAPREPLSGWMKDELPSSSSCV